MKRKQMHIRTIAVVLAVAVSVSSCSIVNPYVAVDNSQLNTRVTLEEAVSYAVETRDEYYCAISEHTLFNRTIGIVIVGAAAAALAIGVTGGSTDVIAGLGTGGAGLFGMHQVLYSANRPKIYAEGAKAIGCTLAAFAGVRAADASRLEPTRDPLDPTRERPSVLDHLAAQIDDLGLALAAIPPNFEDPEQEIPRATQVLEAGRATLARGREARALVRSAGVRLYDAVESVRAQINSALLSNEPDVAQLVSGLSKTLPAYAGMITGREIALPVGEQEVHADLDDKSRARLDDLRRKAALVEATSREVESIIASIGAAPTAAQVEACGINATDSGLNFRADPTTVVIDTSAADQTAEVIASGGKAPYHAQWAGEIPGSEVTLHPVDHDRGSRNQGIITITATQGAAGNYELRVTDEGNGRGTVLVTIRSTGGQRSGGGSTGTPPTPIDPDIAALQKALIDRDCLPATGVGGQTNADGHLGPLTEAALKKLMATVGDQETDFDTLFKKNGQFKPVEAQKYVDDAKAAGIKCAAAPPSAPEPSPTP